MERTFEDHLAVREMTPLLIGLAGPSGCGKTYSALRLANGIQRVSGGKIFGIDTEGRRMLHYADEFNFQHVPFNPPFGSLDYLLAIRYCAEHGAHIVIVDSMSHEHEGSGGYLELHAAEEERLQGNAAARFAAWQVPSKERNHLIQGILQLPLTFVFCFRSKEKLKPGKEDGKSVMRELGWMPIGGQAFLYEMTVCCLLPPNARGTPSWKTEDFSEEQALWIKKGKAFDGLFKQKQQLTEEIGEAMAKWATGGKPYLAGALPALPVHQEILKPKTGPDESEPCPVCKTNVPRCRECRYTMVFVPSGITRKLHEVYSAFWSCPNHCKDSKDRRKNTNVRAADQHAILTGAPPTIKKSDSDDLLQNIHS